MTLLLSPTARVSLYKSIKFKGPKASSNMDTPMVISNLSSITYSTPTVIYDLMINISILILIFGIIFHRNNFLIITMILELIYLLIGFLLISVNMDIFAIYVLAITGCETALGLSILLGYYIRSIQ